MKVRNVRDHQKNWVQTISSIVALLFTLAASFGWLTPEQSAEAVPLVASTIGAFSAGIAGLIALWSLIFKKSDPV